MSGNEIAGATALVTGASRGFGRGIATALSGAGAHVIGVARDRGALEELRAELGESFTGVPADAADPMVAGALIDTYHPGVLVLNAGATPLPRPIQHHTWQTFSRNWEVRDSSKSRVVFSLVRVLLGRGIAGRGGGPVRSGGFRRCSWLLRVCGRG
jgi:NADP-dependent 3-hydroxy acid dehydrogenase YdfG